MSGAGPSRIAAALALALLALPEALAIGYVESSTGLGTPALEAGMTELEIVDVDGDGNPDVVSIGDHGNPGIGSDERGLMVWFGDGHGAFTVFKAGEFGYGGIALGDVNGDGRIDAGYGMHHNYAATDFGDQILEVALGDGTGRAWTPWDDGLAGNGEDWGMFGSDFADVDGDGRLDLGSVSFGCCNGVHVYRNGGDGSWTQTFAVTGGNSRDEIAFGDVNADGWPDLAASHDAGTVYAGDGRGGFALADSNLPAIGYLGREGVALGDVNGDGRDDLAWINSGGGPEVFVRNADGTWTDFGGALPATGPWEAAQLWDMDGDGNTDLCLFGNAKVHVYKGSGAGGWTQLATWSLPTYGYYAAFRAGADVDHNGYPDLALVSEEGTYTTRQNHLRLFKETTAASTLRVRIEKPGPGAALRTGTVRFVHWAAEVPTGAPGTARIEYSRTGATGPWILVADGVPNGGRYQWTVPDVAGSADLRLRVTVTAGSSSASAVSAGALRLLPGHDALSVRFSSRTTLAWTDRMGRAAFDVHRGDWSRFVATGEYAQDPAAVPTAARWCALAATSLDDPFVPAAGASVFYLVAGAGAPGLEGSLGTRSDGVERPNANPCP